MERSLKRGGWGREAAREREERKEQQEEEGEKEEEKREGERQERVLRISFDHLSPWMKLCLNHT